MILKKISNSFYKYRTPIVLSLLVLLGEYSLLIGLRGEAHPEFLAIVYVLWVLTFLPALLVIAICSPKTSRGRTLAFTISLFLLVFLYFSLPTVKYGTILLNRNFETAKKEATIIAGKLDIFHREHGRYPSSIKELYEEDSTLEIPQFSYSETAFYYSEDPDKFSLTLGKPGFFFDDIVIEYTSETRGWQELSD